MIIDEIREDMEEAIRDIICKFQDTTGIDVDCIEVTHHHGRGNAKNGFKQLPRITHIKTTLAI